MKRPQANELIPCEISWAGGLTQTSYHNNQSVTCLSTGECYFWARGCAY